MAIPPLCSNVEIVWESPYYRRFLNHLKQHVRVTAFDKRGIGMSDKLFEPPTLDQRVRDVVAVMDAAGLERAALIGASEGGLMAQCFAAVHPERVSKLVLANPVPALSWLLDSRQRTSSGPAHDFLATISRFDELTESWGHDPQFMVDWFVPSLASDRAFVGWMGRFQRQSATPADLRRQIASITSIQVGDVHGAISAPTLVLHTAGDRVVPVGCSEALAGLIRGATFVSVAGDDHFSELTPRWREIADRWLEFVTGQTPRGAKSMRRNVAMGWASLTPTERKVVDLLQLGLTNRQIGEQLGSSARTVETHITHVFGKLAIGSRVELAAAAARRADEPGF